MPAAHAAPLCALRTVLVALLLACTSPAVAQRAPAAKPFERIDGCVLEPDEWTDGDSFRVRLPDGRLETFRLYFVDTTESRLHSSRSAEQAAYFGITPAEAVQLGDVAKQFTRSALARPFTVQTRWRAVFGPSRYYAVVHTAAGEDLAELLVRHGLARIYGTRTPLPDGRNSRQYLAKLAELEELARRDAAGGWRRAAPVADSATE